MSNKWYSWAQRFFIFSYGSVLVITHRLANYILPFRIIGIEWDKCNRFHKK